MGKYSKVLLFFIIAVSCNVIKEDDGNKQLANDSIYFIVLKIYKSPADSNHIIELVNKTQSKGKVKSLDQNTAETSNYLTIYAYNNQKLLDTARIEHPSYKRLEYVDANKNLSVKDTLIDKAEFFLRFQTPGIDEIRILETIKNRTKNKSTIIKI